MKKLLALIGTLVLTSTVQAQTTNITLTLNVREPTRTNDMTAELSQKEIRGLSVIWEKDIMLATQQTNAAPSFRRSSLDWFKLELVQLQRISDADKARRAKMKELFEYILANPDAVNATQQNQLDAMVTALGL